MTVSLPKIFHVINVLFIITYTTPVFLAAAVPLIIFYFVMQVRACGGSLVIIFCTLHRVFVAILPSLPHLYI